MQAELFILGADLVPVHPQYGCECERHHAHVEYSDSDDPAAPLEVVGRRALDLRVLEQQRLARHTGAVEEREARLCELLISEQKQVQRGSAVGWPKRGGCTD